MNWIGMLIGAAVGALLSWILRCPGNTCLITSNWWILTLIGAVFGLTWNMKGSTKEKKPDLQEQEED